MVMGDLYSNTFLIQSLEEILYSVNIYFGSWGIQKFIFQSFQHLELLT